MATASNSSMFSKLYTNFKAYHAKHPIIVSYCIIAAVSGVFIARMEYLVDPRLECVSKYKTHYVVMRPDDPRTTMIKHKRIGLDY